LTFWFIDREIEQELSLFLLSFELNIKQSRTLMFVQVWVIVQQRIKNEQYQNTLYYLLYIYYSHLFKKELIL